ncbi:hypothetical protein RND71_011686 [Anisodus tanguticus]|uniref:Uncharacterized protein n=1 Tax=Anisodus tanguticus TaxID=243964 RepID=A0AAE1SE78_9SOLA|nr:hypothetical protein RND71_011686 [Anisodus tanguticus]
MVDAGIIASTSHNNSNEGGNHSGESMLSIGDVDLQMVDVGNSASFSHNNSSEENSINSEGHVNIHEEDRILLGYVRGTIYDNEGNLYDFYLKHAKVLEFYIKKQNYMYTPQWKYGRITCDKAEETFVRNGDAKAMMSFFRRMKSMNPEFYHTFELDGEGRLKDVL